MAPKITDKEFQKRMDELRELILRSVDPLDDDPEIREERKARGEFDKMFFAETYFPHYWEDEPAPFHPEMFELADIEKQLIMIFGFRGCAKSVNLSLIDVIHKIVYEKRWFPFYISTSEQAGMEYTGPVKEEFDSNRRLIDDFGIKILPGFNEYFDFRTSNGRRVMTIGAQGSAKGKRVGPHRPDHLIFEDMDDRNKSQSLRVVKKRIKWIETDVMQGVNPKLWSALFLGNHYSKKTIGHLLSKKPGVKVRNYPKLENERSTWGSRFPTAEVKKERENLGTYVFNTEMQQIPMDEEDQVISEDWIQYYEPAEIENKNLRIFAKLDPSAKKGEEHDFKAILIIGVAVPELIYYVLYAWIKKRSKWQMIRTAYELDRDFHFEVLGIPDVAFESTLQEDFDLQAKEEGYYLKIRLMPERMAKEVYIARYSSLFERGKLKFRKNHSDQNLCVEQCISFPDGNDDGPNALAGAIELAEVVKGGIKYESVSRRSGIAGLFRRGIF